VSRLLIVLIVLITGATTVVGSTVVPSEALTIARAAGLKHVRDATQKDLQRASIETGAPMSPSMMAVMDAGTATGILDPTPGLSRGLDSGLALMGAFLLSLPVGYAEVSPRLLIWMPQQLAATPEAAAALMRGILMRGIAETFPRAHIEFHETQVEKTKSQSYISVDAEGCTDCRIFSLTVENGRLPRTQTAPAVLGSYHAYAWGGPNWKGQGDGLLSGYPLTADALRPEERVAFYQGLSRHLPEWIYVYVSPGAQLAPYPQIFHQGQQLLFIEPAAMPTAAP
jgi:hypothetical protein